MEPSTDENWNYFSIFVHKITELIDKLVTYFIFMFVIFNQSNFEVRETFMKKPMHGTNKLNEIKEREMIQ